MPLSKSNLAENVHAHDFAQVRDKLDDLPPSQIASLIGDLPDDEQAVAFRCLPRKLAATTFDYLPSIKQHRLLKALAHDEVAEILNTMAPDDRTVLLEELPGRVTKELISLLNDEERAEAVKLLGYPENSVGRFMTPHYVAVRPNMSVTEVLDYVRGHGHDSETLNMIYVEDEHGILVDDIRMRSFLLAPLNKTVAELMDNRFVALKASDNQRTAVAVFERENLTALPVTDSEGMLIGIVTIDDVLRVAEASATRDIQKIGGMEALDEPYMQISFWRMVKKRASWLVVIFLGEMLTATAMGFFEKEIERAVVLALFVPLVISSGGNSGSQATTLVIRALALGEITLRDWWRIMRREILTGLALGSVLGTVGFLRITIWSRFSTIYGQHWLLVAWTIGIALVGIVLWGTLIGSMLPFILRRLGLDPATSSAPFVATLVDVTGLVIYFGVAMIILRGTLL